MKTLKQVFVLGLSVAAALAPSFVDAATVTVNSQSSLYSASQCDGRNDHWYVYAGTDGYEMTDTFTYSDSTYVWQMDFGSSWVSSYNAIPNALKMPTLTYLSNGKPHNVNTIVVMGALGEGGKITSSIPNTYKRSDVAAQVVYHVSRIKWVYKAGSDNTMKYLDYNNLGAGTQTYKYNVSFPSQTYSDNECLNVHIGFCGDGILDNGSKNSSYNANEALNGGEQCDPKDPNKTNWGTAGCSATCEPINEKVQPACNSNKTGKHYNSDISKPLLKSTDVLCNPGEVTSFVGPVEPGRTYSWTCNGEAGTTPADCSAQEMWCGDGEVQQTYEACDPNDPNKKNWGTDGCSASCQPKDKPEPEVTPFCNSAYTGSHYNKNYPAALLNADLVLCNPGEVSNFVGPVEPGRTYSWKCNGSAGKTPADCTAKELWCGDGKVQTDYEACDPNDPNQTNWNGKVCNNSCQLVDKKIYDLALTKKLNDESKTSYKLGDSITYKITVYNQGNYTAKNIEITEYIPNGLILNDSSWSLSSDGTKATRTISDEIAPGSSKSVTLKMKIDTSFTGTKILNKAEISKDNASDYGEKDIDSDPDNNPDNDCLFGEDNHIITGNGKGYTEDNKACDETTDEDDHDVVPIYIEEEPGEPTIDKNLLGDKDHKYKTGELVGFKMVFKNTTSTTVKHAKIKDFLPLNLEYVSSEIKGVSPILSGLYKASNGQTVLEYSGFDLAPGQEGYLIMTGKVLNSNLKNRINTVCIYGNDKKNADGSDSSYVCDSDAYKMGGIQIEKTVDKTYVVSGDVVEYTITVTATDGSYTGFTIVDTLPKGVVFKNDLYLGLTTPYSVTVASGKKPNIDFSTSKSATGLDIQTWNVSFPDKFNEGDVFVLKFKANVTETLEGKYTNVACLIPPEEEEKCDHEDVVTDIKLKIKKYVSDSLTGTWHDDSMVLANGKIAYFKLVIDGAVEPMQTFTVKDKLNDAKLLFSNESWNIAGNLFTGNITFGTENQGSHNYDIKPIVTNASGYTQLVWLVDMQKGKFMSGDTLTIVFMAEKKADETNKGYVCYEKNEKTVCEEDPAKVTSEDIKLGITKKVSTTQDVNGDWQDTKGPLDNPSDVYFKLVIAGASEPMKNFRVKDTLNDNKLLFQDKSWTIPGNYFTGVMAFGTGNNGDKTSYTIIPTVTGNNGTHELLWKVNMGSGYFVKGDTLTIIFAAQKKDAETNTAYVCYDKDVDGTTKEICEKDTANVTNPSSPGGGGGCTNCGGGGGSTPTCGDGKKGGIEMCDLGGTKVVGSDGKLFNNGDAYEKEYAGWTCTSSCTLKNENGEAPKCFNVQNGSISIMKGEMLPFYWNMEGALGLQSKGNAERTKYLNANFVTRCSEKDSDGHISLETMMCNFIVYGPNKKQKQGVMDNPVYEFNAPCVGTNAWGNPTYPAIKSFIEQNKNGWFKGSQLNTNGDAANVFASLDNWIDYPTLAPISSKVIINGFGNGSKNIAGAKTVGTSNVINLFGEYKIALKSVTYDICSDGKDGSSITVNDRVCEVDFAVTDPYMVQKSTYGSNALDTPLKNYKTKNGYTLFDITKEVNPTDYSVPANLATTFDKFVSKYSKLAKATGKTNLTKVSGKSIYFYSGKEIYIDGNGGSDSFIKNTGTPFTLIATDPNAKITIRGNLFSNAMIMTKGTIVFDAKGACNGNVDSIGEITYGHAGQMVRGIFYAGKGFDSVNDVKNTSTSNSEWCNYGNLHIKGVAIGSLTNVVNKRRSELYTWFREKSDTAEQKRDVVLNGASVLVEYNPDLWGSLPPGAEEFNKALEVYRK